MQTRAMNQRGRERYQGVTQAVVCDSMCVFVAFLASVTHVHDNACVAADHFLSLAFIWESRILNHVSPRESRVTVTLW